MKERDQKKPTILPIGTLPTLTTFKPSERSPRPSREGHQAVRATKQNTKQNHLSSSGLSTQPQAQEQRHNPSRRFVFQSIAVEDVLGESSFSQQRRRESKGFETDVLAAKRNDELDVHLHLHLVASFNFTSLLLPKKKTNF